MKNVFDKDDAAEIINRINNLEPNTERLWGKMSVGQMLAHCNVTYEMVYDNKHKQPGAFKKIILKLLVKSSVVSEKTYCKNSRTAPQFIITDNSDFEKEKNRLVEYVKKTQELGASHFENKESHSFGELSSNEWNNMYYKHLNHHLQQFGV